MPYVNINGKITLAEEARLPVDNGAFRFGYGVFGTMLVRGGTIWLGEYHWERLFAGMQQLYFELPALMTPGWLEEQVLRMVSKNHMGQLCRVRVQVYAGGGGLFGDGYAHPGFVIECFPIEEDPDTLNENGLVLGFATGIDKSINSLSNLKSCNALIYAMAARQAKANKWNDALLCNTNGHIIESAIANIFWIKDGITCTPPLTDGCVAGVVRRYIMETIPVTEKSLAVEELLAADEVYLTNAIKKIHWVGRIGDREYANTQIRHAWSLLSAADKTMHL